MGRFKWQCGELGNPEPVRSGLSLRNGNLNVPSDRMGVYPRMIQKSFGEQDFIVKKPGITWLLFSIFYDYYQL